MRFFFRSRQFKIILLSVIVLAVLSVTFLVIGGRMSPQSNLLGSMAAPFRSAATAVSGAASDFVSAYRDGERLILENTELENELDELRTQLADYQQMKEENEFYKQYLGIKDEHPDFTFCKANRISADPEDPYFGFVINKGTVNGIAAYDPVITEAGLVGYVSEAGLTTSKVTTIFSAELTAGALDNRTGDSGIVCGSVELAKQGKTRFRNLSRSCSIAVGDYVVTSGEGVFPEGILIGMVQSIGSDPYNTSIYADLEPFADIESIKGVMVLTDFEGQGGLKP
ncbi:MAG: rod shape-determining protein MreC [Clostridia bacterium]|nr:rod shape-determining protein MreC [Clostridia bacterium]